jgi:Lhr-like helicase
VRKALAGELRDCTEVLYVSPLKALGNDIQKNLEVPLGEILALAGQRGLLMPEIRTAVRTGDTLMKERRDMLKRPPHILVTTPESLYILLTANSSRAILSHVKTVIVDEIHAVADDKRGAHLTLSLERLDLLAGRPTRIGLSATQKPIEEVAHFLTGADRPAPGHREHRPSPHARSRCRSSAFRTWSPSPATRCGARSTTASPNWRCNIARRWSSSTRGGWPSAWRCIWASASAKTWLRRITAAWRAG